MSTEIRNGLIGVGLINVEDRSGVLSLDKGKFLYFIYFSLIQKCMHCSPSKIAFFYIDYNNIGKFLNRILGMEVQQQNALFQYFSDTLNAVIQNAKKNGRYDMGILGKSKTCPISCFEDEEFELTVF